MTEKKEVVGYTTEDGNIYPVRKPRCLQRG
jgi:hypothetical protein